MNKIFFLLLAGFGISLIPGCDKASTSDPKNHSEIKEQDSAVGFDNLAQTPPMGWNSYNSYGAAVQEDEVKANADFMAGNLKDLGWEYIVVDFCWYYPHPPNSIQNNPPQFRLPLDSSYVPWLNMDEYGRLLPDPRKFPSSREGKGFKSLSDYVHDLGLKFGIHVMRGIPRQAVWAKTPVRGAEGIDASMIADTTSICRWLDNMYGIDMSKPGAQEYMNSLYELYASWGVDYIKLDDALYDPYHQEEIEAANQAIRNSGRPMVLSLSPGIRDFSKAAHVSSNSNLWRISADFWDNWDELKEQFEICEQWNPHRSEGHWPDADMLQLGLISRRGPKPPERYTRFTWDEQLTHMTLWSIYRSPLMFGGDLPMNNDSTNSLITNEEVIRVNQQGKNPRLVSKDNDLVVWVSKAPEANSMYVALFNLNDNGPLPVKVQFNDIGLNGECRVRDLWSKEEIGNFHNQLEQEVNAHGARLFQISIN